MWNSKAWSIVPRPITPNCLVLRKQHKQHLWIWPTLRDLKWARLSCGYLLVFVLIILSVLQSVVEQQKGWKGWYLEAFSVIRPFAASKQAVLLGQVLFMAVWGEKIQTPVKMKTISHLSDTAMPQAWVHKRRRMGSNRKLLDKEEYEWRIQVGKVRGYWLR